MNYIDLCSLVIQGPKFHGLLLDLDDLALWEGVLSFHLVRAFLKGKSQVVARSAHFASANTRSPDRLGNLLHQYLNGTVC